MRVPSATYRLQFNPGFGFRDAVQLVPYLHELGITDLYASPIFTTRPGSTHGYDVTDPLSLNPELGAEEDFEALVRALRDWDMGLLLDVVPNHMAATPDNAWWADVLENGQASAYAKHFDIDWGRGGGKVVLPVLGRPLDETLQAGELTLAADEQGLCIRYQMTRLPIAPSSHSLAERLAAEERRDLRPLLDEQAYRLAYWRTGTREINYRRFFSINELVGVRVEDKAVFDATHERIIGLVRDNAVAGLRVDHIDGLYDPAAYLDRLQSALRGGGKADTARGGAYVIVEKILTGDETLCDDWDVSGTTGYDFVNSVNGLFVDAEGLERLSETYAKLTGSTGTLADTAYEQKRRMASHLFEGETRQLAGQLTELASQAGIQKQASQQELSEALVAVSASLPVYRTYVREFHVAARDREQIDRAVQAAGRRNPKLSAAALAFVHRVLLLDMPPSLSKDERLAWLSFVTRWQQFTGPLTAKGVEDTALYQHNRLVSVNEVGVDPQGTGSLDAEAFHQRNQTRLERWPHTLSATATHDTKRGEDTRARINVLSELADEWSSRLGRWVAWNEDRKPVVNGVRVPESNAEALLYQTIVGAWPLDETEVPAFRERLKAYMVKAAREAKVHTSWLEPAPEYERALAAFVDAVLEQPASTPFVADLLSFQRTVAFYGAMNSLSQLVLKMASPGVPDFYQGTELWDLTLVDPDNRRPVDFDRRERLLRDLLRQEAAGPLALVRDLLERWQDGRIKLYVTARVVRWRRGHSALFREGQYTALSVSAAVRRNLVAFARHGRGEWAIVVVPRMHARLVKPGTPPVGRAAWRQAALELPGEAPRTWVNIFTGETADVEHVGDKPTLPLHWILGHLPVAVLAGSG